MLLVHTHTHILYGSDSFLTWCRATKNETSAEFSGVPSQGKMRWNVKQGWYVQYFNFPKFPAEFSLEFP